MVPRPTAAMALCLILAAASYTSADMLGDAKAAISGLLGGAGAAPSPAPSNGLPKSPDSCATGLAGGWSPLNTSDLIDGNLTTSLYARFLADASNDFCVPHYAQCVAGWLPAGAHWMHAAWKRWMIMWVVPC